LIVDAHAVLPGSIASQSLEAIARKSGQVGQAGGGIEPVEASLRLTRKP
jgi:hypothetical protein